MEHSAYRKELRQSINRIHRRLNRFSERLEYATLAEHKVDKGTQILLQLKYRELAQDGVTLPFSEVGFRNFSQDEEDGILHYIFSVIGATDRRAVEMCAGNGVECNTANLIINHYWQALLVDGNKDLVKEGVDFYARHPDTRVMSPVFRQDWISRESVNQILREEGLTGELDLLSLDLDGVDYWIWDAIDEISPRVAVVEVMPALGTRSLTVPYAENFAPEWVFLGPPGERPKEMGELVPGGFGRNWTMYAGASLPAFNKLAKRKGYRLVGASTFGHNAFFMREDVGENYFPEVTEEQCVNSNYTRLYERAWDRLKEFDWQAI